ncbi:MAG: CvpA family protein [Alphaproteobacteria bacterium]|nr:CvpA family protein [Alphaproteobacteria bacterium]
MIIDIVVLLIILASVLIAFLRGFVREVLTILGIIGGLAAAYFGGPYFVPIMNGWLGVQEIAEGEEQAKLFDLIPYIYVSRALAYGGIFTVVVGVLSLLSHLLAEFISKIGLGALDRTLGVVFGLVRGILLVGIIYLPVYANAKTEDKKKWLEGSKCAPYMEAVAGWMFSFAPKDMQEQVEKLSGQGNPAQKLLEAQGLVGGSGKDDKAGSEDKKDEKPGDKGGYTDKERDAMDKLIEEQSKGALGLNE